MVHVSLGPSISSASFLSHMFLYPSQTQTEAPQALWSSVRVKGVFRPEHLRTIDTKTRERVVPPSDDDNTRTRRGCKPVGSAPAKLGCTSHHTTGEAVQLRDHEGAAISVTPAPIVQAGVCVPCRDLKCPALPYKGKRPLGKPYA